MKLSSVLAAAAFVGGLALAVPASAQSNIPGLGDARQRDLPSSVGALNEGRSYYGYRRHYRPFYRPYYRPYYRAYRPRYRYGY